MDLVKLAIVYETQSAAQKLSQLDRLLQAIQANTQAVTGSTNRLRGAMNTASGSLRSGSRAAVGLAQALATGNISATALTSRLGALGGKAGAVGLVIAAAAGVLLLFKNHADKAREAAFKFQDQLRDTQRAVDDLLRPVSKSELQDQIEKITDAITELDRVLAQQRRNIIQRIFGADSLSDFGSKLLRIGKDIKRFFVGGESETTKAQREALVGQRGRLNTGELTAAISGRAGQEFARARSFGALTRGTEAAVVAAQLNIMERELQDLLKILPDDSIQIKFLVADMRDHEAQLRKLQRAQKLVTSGLETIADALEQFIIEGTFAFQDFLNSILRLLYRDLSQDLIANVGRSLSSAAGGPQGGISSEPGKEGPGRIESSSVNMNVNFQVQAIDAQSTQQFFERNGSLIASEVAKAATRSRSIRRAFQRG